MLQAVFRADASKAIGGGHIMRCLTLANFLTDHGWNCCFAVGPQTLQTVPTLTNSPHEVFVLAAGKTDETQASLIAKKFPNIDLMVVDHYQLDAKFEKKMRPFSQKILVIDDIPLRPHDCDVLLDQTLGRKVTDYNNIVPATTTLLVGTEYALLRPEFRAVRAKAIERRQTIKSVQHILISLGASDPHNITKICLEAVSLANLDIEVDVLLGNADPDIMGLCSLADQMSQTVRFHGFEADVAELMASADLAIGAAGSTSWERCCVGLPTLMIVTADNQLTIANELEKAGAVVVLPKVDDLAKEDIAQQLSKGSNIQTLQKMSASAAETCDGLGVLRAFLKIMQQKPPAGVSLCATTMNDAAKHFEWQSAPGARTYSRNSQVPIWEDHVRWINNRISTPKSILLNIVSDNIDSGILRLDPLENPAQDDQNKIFEISILLAPGARGQGLGSRALMVANSTFCGDHIIAEVHPDNAASWRIFEQAGYRKTSSNRLERLPS